MVKILCEWWQCHLNYATDIKFKYFEITFQKKTKKVERRLFIIKNKIYVME